MLAGMYWLSQNSAITLSNQLVGAKTYLIEVTILENNEVMDTAKRDSGTGVFL